MSRLDNEELLGVAVDACLDASNVIMSSLDIPKETRFKGKTDLVTEIDIRSEKIIKSVISSSFNDHSIWAEETGKEETTSDYVWIIDPLDGTTNFVHGYPPFGISIGVLYKGKPIVGAILEMPLMRLFTAIDGEGSFCEGEKIKCSNTQSFEKSLLVTGFGYEHGDNWETNMRLFKNFTDKTQGVRRSGSAAIDMCYVASGKLDAFWEFDLKPWDIAAGLVIAKESGCIITGIGGGDFNLAMDNILISNKHIHSNIVKEAGFYLN